MARTRTLDTCVDDLAAGRASSRSLLDLCLANIAKSREDATRVFIELDEDGARRAADEQDRLRRQDRHASPFAGIPFSVKDLFDVKGQKTRAGSPCREGESVVQETAASVQRLISAGMIPIGRTNMTEFAYSGLGLNPHYGVPPNRWDGAGAYAPGGSSSGAASSVKLEMAVFGLGSDTGGSCRIPAAFQGLIGYKPTASSVSRAGMLPLSPSLDSIGPIARSVRSCAAIWRVLAGLPQGGRGPPIGSAAPKLFVPETVVMEQIETAVAQDFERALSDLSRQGWQIGAGPLPVLEDIVEINARGGFPALESHRLLGEFVQTHLGDIDPRVASRIRRGATLSDCDAKAFRAARQAAIAGFATLAASYDAIAFPTVAITPPRLSDLVSDDAYYKTNALVLRNTSFVNFLDGCSISIPMHQPGAPPTGFMLSAASGADEKLLQLAGRAERIIRRAE